jgi:hypothetical protein
MLTVSELASVTEEKEKTFLLYPGFVKMKARVERNVAVPGQVYI